MASSEMWLSSLFSRCCFFIIIAISSLRYAAPLCYYVCHAIRRRDATLCYAAVIHDAQRPVELTDDKRDAMLGARRCEARHVRKRAI